MSSEMKYRELSDGQLLVQQREAAKQAEVWESTLLASQQAVVRAVEMRTTKYAKVMEIEAELAGRTFDRKRDLNAAVAMAEAELPKPPLVTTTFDAEAEVDRLLAANPPVEYEKPLQGIDIAGTVELDKETGLVTTYVDREKYAAEPGEVPAYRGVEGPLKPPF